MQPTLTTDAAAPFYPAICDHLAAQVLKLGRLFAYQPAAVLDYFRGRVALHGGHLLVFGALTPTEAVLLRVNGPDMVKILAREAKAA